MNAVSAAQARSVSTHHINPAAKASWGVSLTMQQLALQDMAKMMDQRPHPALRLEKEALIKAFMDESPQATRVGEIADSIFKVIASFFKVIVSLWSKFKTEDKIKQTARNLFESLDEQDSPSCNTSYPSEISCLPITTGLNSTNWWESNCTYVDPSTYYAHFIITGLAQKAISNLQACIKGFIDQCKRSCFNCWNIDNDQQRIGANNFTHEFTSTYYPGRRWKVIIEASEDIYVYTKMDTEASVEGIIAECEEFEEDTDYESAANLVVGLVIGAAGLLFAVLSGVLCYCRYRDWNRERRERVPLLPDQSVRLKDVQIENEVEEVNIQTKTESEDNLIDKDA